MRLASLLASVLLLTQVTLAQDKTAPRVVKSDAVEMKAAPLNEVPAQTFVSVGDFDMPPAITTCSKMKGDERQNCTAAEVVKALHSAMTTPELDMKMWGGNAVTITFVVNPYGETKNFRVDHPGDQTLYRNAMAAVSQLPRFDAATKGSAGAQATVTITTTYGALFEGR